MNPNLKIGVGGCVASQEGENILKSALCRSYFWTSNTPQGA